ncbi:MAG: hypothetical protein Kilf2KO_22120 [Rhodospirillales bacterium]
MLTAPEVDSRTRGETRGLWTRVGTLLQGLFSGYRPEKRYMRGPAGR